MSHSGLPHADPPSLPRVAITVGDVSGVGPELAMRCATMEEVTQRCHPILLGPVNILRKLASELSLTLPPDLVDVGNVDGARLQAGQFTAATGMASYLAVTQAIDLALKQEVAALVTGPIQKEAWHLASIPYPGHTELLQKQTESPRCAMMLTSEAISCVLATIHIPLADVASQLSRESITEAIDLASATMTRKLQRAARVTVCGLNPHAGENGMFSHGEEDRIIQPAIHQARERGIHVTGPVPPDTAFTPRLRQQTDVYVCMYHDQGLIPLKALAFDDAVNVTLGLPIIRTSVDHGTALDLAWKGEASWRSMLAAIHLAVDLCRPES